MKNKQGITLIALVVSIIVLLILAGVAITMLAGDNGVLNKAAEAKVKTEEAKDDESYRLAVMEAGTNINGKTHIETIKVDGKEINLTAPIPAGFVESPREGEQSIETGLVVIDSTGNEYVWIPVFDSNQVDWGAVYPNTLPEKTANISEFTETHILAIKTALRGTSSAGYTKTYIEGSLYSDDWYGKDSTGDAYSKYYYTENGTDYYYSNGNLSREEYTKLYNNMLISIYKNGGFYIGRYEMGTAVVNTPEAASKVSRTQAKKDIEYKSTTNNLINQKPKITSSPVIKKNAVPYNYITQSQAEMLAEDLNHEGVEDSLLFGVQWDMVCVYLEHFGKIDGSAIQNAEDTFTKKYVKVDYDNDSNEGSVFWGNYQNSTFKLNQGFYTTTYTSSTVTWETTNKAKNISDLWICTTGASEQNKVLNIYDFAGNVEEWTLERRQTNNVPCVNRGYCFAGDNSASYRTYGASFNSEYYHSARPQLYIK